MATKKATPIRKAATKRTSAAAGKKAPAKKTAAKKVAVRNTSTKQATAKKASAKKTAATKSAQTSSTKAPGQHAAPKKTSTSDKYSDPALRERIKAKVVREGKGGRPGQWSARKAQMVAHEYEAEGGKYRGGRNESQKNLTAWGDEHWTTQDGKPARQKDGMHRYLPEKAWEEMSAAEKRATEKKKLAGDKQGKQFVANTSPAVKARRDAEKKAARR